MSAFNLTAQLNLVGPTNIRQVVGDIRKQIGTIKGDIDLNISPQTAKVLAQINQQSSGVKKELGGLASAGQNTKKSFDSLNQSVNNLKISPITTKSQQAAESIKKMGIESRTSSQNVKILGNELAEFGRQSGLAIRRFAAFTLVSGIMYKLNSAVSQALSQFIDFDREIIRLSQVTGQSVDQLNGLVTEITRLSTSTGVASEELIKVSTTLAQAGLSAQQTKQALEALALSANAPSFDNLNDTVEGSIALMRQFGISTKDLEQALGSINAVSAAFAVEAGDIISAISRTGGVFASASKGVSEGTQALNEFIAIFTSVRATTRESAETIATGLRTIFTRIQRQSTVEALQALGVELRDAQGQFVGAFEAVKRLSQGLNQIDPRSQVFASIVEELGGFRQIGKVIPLIQQFATAESALKVALQGGGSLAEANRKAQQSLAVQLAKTREEFVALVRDFAGNDVFKGFLTTTLSLTKGLLSLARAGKGLFPLLTIVGGFKAISAATQFAGGFASGVRPSGGQKNSGGAQGIGKGIGELLTGAKSQKQVVALEKIVSLIQSNTDSLKQPITNLSSTIQQNIISINDNTSALKLATDAINALTSAINSNKPSAELNNGGRVLGFSKGGSVPGSGKGDKVPALLEPGEVVMSNRAVSKYGRGNLVRMNRYATGGDVANAATKYNIIGASYIPEKDQYTFKKDTSKNFDRNNKFNAKDNIRFQVEEKKVDVDSLYGDDPNNSLYIQYRNEKNASKRGRKFEQIIIDKYNQFEPSGYASYLDGVFNNQPAEIKSRENISERDLGKKFLASAISGNRKSKELSDQLSGNRLKKLELTDDPEDVNLGSLTLINDDTKSITTFDKNKQASQGAIKTVNLGNIISSKNNLGGKIQRFMNGGEPEETNWGDTAPARKIIDMLGIKNAVEIVARALAGSKDPIPEGKKALLYLDLSGKKQVDAANVEKLLKRKAPTSDEALSIKAIREEATKTFNRKRGASQGVQTRLTAQGLRFAAVGMFGKPFPEDTYDAEGTRGNRRVVLLSGIMDSVLAAELDALFIEEGTKIARLGATIAKRFSGDTSETESSMLDTNTESNLSGALFEKMLGELGAPVAAKGLGFDFPQGLKGAAKYFGIPDDIPTDAKRTIRGKATIKDNVATYLEAMGYKVGGLVQRFKEGSPGGMMLGKGRGKKGSKGARDVIEPINTETYLKWAQGIYREYENDPSLVMTTDELGIRMPSEIALANRLLTQYALEKGGAGLSVGTKFVRTPKENIIDELRPYLVPDPSDPNELGFFQDDVRRFSKRIKTPLETSEDKKRFDELNKRKTTSRMQRQLFRYALEGIAKSVKDKKLTEEQMSALSPDVLETLSKDPKSQVFSLPKLESENFVADAGAVKPKFIAWGKDKSGGNFRDVVSGFEDQIRKGLGEPEKSRFESLLDAGSLEAYKAAGGKDGHIPPLKKAIYQIIGITSKSLGGLIQSFKRGGYSRSTYKLVPNDPSFQMTSSSPSSSKIDYFAILENLGVPEMMRVSLAQFAKTNNLTQKELEDRARSAMRIMSTQRSQSIDPASLRPGGVTQKQLDLARRLQDQSRFAQGGLTGYRLQSRELNTSIATGNLSSEQQKDITNLDSLMTDDLPSRLYSGFKTNRRSIIESLLDQEKNYTQLLGKTFSFPSYLSTSLNEDVARTFGDIRGGLLHINSRGKGINVLKRLGSGSAKGLYEAEAEYILPRNSKFKIRNLIESVKGPSPQGWPEYWGKPDFLELEIDQYKTGGLIQKFAYGGKATQKQIGFIASLLKGFGIEDIYSGKFNPDLSIQETSTYIDNLKNNRAIASRFKTLREKYGQRVFINQVGLPVFSRDQYSRKLLLTSALSDEDIENYILNGVAPKGAVDAPLDFRGFNIEQAAAAGTLSASRSDYRARQSAVKQFGRRRFADGGMATEKNYGKIKLKDGDSFAGSISASYMGGGGDGEVYAQDIGGGLYAVTSSAATQGYGPRLYDVVMESVTQSGKKLVSDRNRVSDSAKRVWEYYLTKRSDVQKTPLTDTSKWYTGRQLDMSKFFSDDPTTWPSYNDIAWALNTAYSKSPSLINDKNTVERFADGGTVPALVSNGEAYVPPKIAKKIGYGTLNRMNQADRNGMGRFSEGGISIFKGPGNGTSDSIPTNLPVGSFIIREKATKALGLNKGGAIGIRRFFKGGQNIADAERAQGTVLSDISQASQVFVQIMSSLGPEIKQAILEKFKGIKELNPNDIIEIQGKKRTVGETARGRARFESSGKELFFRTKGKDSATTETVAHETGHLADVALGGGKGYASEMKGTFQFDLIEKIKPKMIEAFVAAGKSSEDIKRYLASNRELFAEFFAKASPEIRAIITSTTDAKKGMVQLADSLGDTGFTYAGLQALDIDQSRKMPPTENVKPLRSKDDITKEIASSSKALAEEMSKNQKRLASLDAAIAKQEEATNALFAESANLDAVINKYAQTLDKRANERGKDRSPDKLDVRMSANMASAQARQPEIEAKALAAQEKLDKMKSRRAEITAPADILKKQKDDLIAEAKAAKEAEGPKPPKRKPPKITETWFGSDASKSIGGVADAINKAAAIRSEQEAKLETLGSQFKELKSRKTTVEQGTSTTTIASAAVIQAQIDNIAKQATEIVSGLNELDSAQDAVKQELINSFNSLTQEIDNAAKSESEAKAEMEKAYGEVIASLSANSDQWNSMTDEQKAIAVEEAAVSSGASEARLAFEEAQVKKQNLEAQRTAMSGGASSAEELARNIDETANPAQKAARLAAEDLENRKNEARRIGAMKAETAAGGRRNFESEEDYDQRKAELTKTYTRQAAVEMGLAQTRYVSAGEAKAIEKDREAERIGTEKEKNIQKQQSEAIDIKGQSENIKAMLLLAQAVTDNTMALGGSSEKADALQQEMSLLAQSNQEREKAKIEVSEKNLAETNRDLDVPDDSELFQDDIKTLPGLDLLEGIGDKFKTFGDKIAAQSQKADGSIGKFASIIQNGGNLINSKIQGMANGIRNANNDFVKTGLGKFASAFGAYGTAIGGGVTTVLQYMADQSNGYETLTGSILQAGSTIAATATTFGTLGAQLGPLGGLMGAFIGAGVGAVNSLRAYTEAQEQAAAELLEESKNQAMENATSDLALLFDSIEPSAEDLESAIANLAIVIDAEKKQISQNTAASRFKSTYGGLFTGKKSEAEMKQADTAAAAANAAAANVSMQIISGLSQVGMSMDQISNSLGSDVFESLKLEIAEADTQFVTAARNLAEQFNSGAITGDQYIQGVEAAKNAAFENATSQLRIKEANEQYREAVIDVRKRLESVGGQFVQDVIRATPKQRGEMRKNIISAEGLLKGDFTASRTQQAAAADKAYRETRGTEQQKREAAEQAKADVRGQNLAEAERILSFGNQSSQEVRNARANLYEQMLQEQGISTAPDTMAGQVIDSLRQKDPELAAQENLQAATEEAAKAMAIQTAALNANTQAISNGKITVDYATSGGVVDAQLATNAVSSEGRSGLMWGAAQVGGGALGLGAGLTVLNRGTGGGVGRFARNVITGGQTPNANTPTPKPIRYDPRTGEVVGGGATPKPRVESGGASKPRGGSGAASRPRGGGAPRIRGGGRRALGGLAIAGATMAAGYFMGGGGGEEAAGGEIDIADNSQVVALLGAIEKNTRCACTGGSGQQVGGMMPTPQEVVGGIDTAINQTLSNTGLSAQQQNIDVGMGISESLADQGIDTSSGLAGAAIANIMSSPETVSQEQLGNARADIVAGELANQGIDINTDAAQIALDAIATSTDPAMTSFANLASMSDVLAAQLANTAAIAQISANAQAASSESSTSVATETRSGMLDWLQTGLSTIGIFGDFIPVVGNAAAVVADLANAGISSARAAATTDENMKKDFMIDAGINAVAAIPYAGIAATVAKGAKTTAGVAKAAKVGGIAAEIGVPMLAENPVASTVNAMNLGAAQGQIASQPQPQVDVSWGQSIIDGLYGLGNMIYAGGEQALGMMWSTVQGLGGWLAETAMTALGGLWEGVKALPGWLYETGMSVLGGVWDIFKSLPGLLIDIITLPFKAGFNIGSFISENVLIPLAQQLYTSAIDGVAYIQEVWPRLSDIMYQAFLDGTIFILDGLAAAGQWIQDQFFRVLGNITNGINDVVYSLISRIPVVGESIAKDIGLQDPAQRAREEKAVQETQQQTTPTLQSSGSAPIIPIFQGNRTINSTQESQAFGPSPQLTQQVQQLALTPTNQNQNTMYNPATGNRMSVVGPSGSGAAITGGSAFMKQVQKYDGSNSLAIQSDVIDAAIAESKQIKPEAETNNWFKNAQAELMKIEASPAANIQNRPNTGGVINTRQTNQQNQEITKSALLGGNDLTDNLQKTFGNFLTNLQNIQFPQIPDIVNMQGQHTVEVIINGAEALRSLEPMIRDLIDTKISQLENKINNITEGGLGPNS